MRIKNPLMGFEEFKGSGGRCYTPKISIRKVGQIGFNTSFVRRYLLEKYTFIILYYNKKTNQIAIEFKDAMLIGDKIEMIKLTKNKNNTFVAAKSFFDYHGIPITKTEKYNFKWYENEKLVVIKL